MLPISKMSDLNDFFAKKDRRRKKATKGGKPSHSADWNSPATESASVSDNAASDSVNSSGNIQAPSTKPSKSDDGWIEIDDPKTARVNTGGKTVEEFRRDYDDKEQNGKEDAPAEKFTGWAVATESAEGTGMLGFTRFTWITVDVTQHIVYSLCCATFSFFCFPLLNFLLFSSFWGTFPSVPSFFCNNFSLSHSCSTNLWLASASQRR